MARLLVYQYEIAFFEGKSFFELLVTLLELKLHPTTTWTPGLVEPVEGSVSVILIRVTKWKTDDLLADHQRSIIVENLLFDADYVARLIVFRTAQVQALGCGAVTFNFQVYACFFCRANVALLAFVKLI